MTFLSNSVYLPIKEQRDEGTLTWQYNKIWLNYIWAVNHIGLDTAIDDLVKYNARLINDVIVFDTEQDKMWFVLNFG